ncbi:MAG: DNA repair protein RecN [Proteobacteria bacterium]|nr:DNA repair protein RecN [Pseudomonadota bacterium]MBU1688049.1 DNA repair protein RecN [Pseudomonadota bacterium]
MLRELRITNLALIAELHIDFSSDYIVLTGETGAGKSIILQAINLLYGTKAARQWVRNGAESATVEALFECVGDSALVRKLAGEDLAEPEGNVILKRVITAKGNSRYYVNGGLATAKIVGEIAENLIGIASQHDHQQLLSPGYHLDFIDAVGGLLPKRRNLSVVFDRWSDLVGQCLRLAERNAEREQRRDFLEYQWREIDEAGIEPGEDEVLDEEKSRLRGADDLIRLGSKSFGLLEDPIIDTLVRVKNDLAQMSSYDHALVGLAEEVAGCCYQLEDATARMKGYLEEVHSNPQQLDQVTARIDLLQKLKRKYGPELDEVIEFGRKALAEVEELTVMDRTIADLERERQGVEQELLGLASGLTEARKQAAERLIDSMMGELSVLCLENARFSVRFQDPDKSGLETIGRSGWDRIEFMFSANPGEPVQPLAKVASGGELSRLMLALKCILAKNDQVETVVFDEIDAGISGKAAESVARKLRELAGHHQILCITHLPQIAAGAHEHYRVDKSLVDDRTQTSIVRLPAEGRIAELARMLDGDSVTDRTRHYVTELLERNR